MVEASGVERLKQFLRDNPLTGTTPAELRAAFAALMEKVAVPSSARRERVDAGGVPGEWLRAEGVAEDRVVLYLHGGGYVVGSVQTHAEMLARLGRAAGARVLAIDYRLAPENPFPAAVEDAVRAWRFLLEQSLEPGRMAIAGESAGGGLTMATLLALKEQGLPGPGAAVCLSPWVDLACTGESLTTNQGNDPLVPSVEMLRMMAALYLGGADARKPLASPLYADLKGVPPLFLQAGTGEVLLDDARRLAERVKAAGGEVVLDLWEGQVHGFQAFPQQVPEAVEALHRAGAFLREWLGRH